MPLLCKGIYADTGEKNYEVEVCYYLLFQIKAAEYSIYCLKKKSQEIDQDMWQNQCEYYHFYCDHLLFSLGQINNRFVSTSRTQRKYKDRIDSNRHNFSFSEDRYPILSNKNYRNTIEHLDEYNIDEIIVRGGVGGFNVIFEGMDEKTKKDILESGSSHPYVYDKVKREIAIFRASNKLVIELDELCDELIRLNKEVCDFKEYWLRFE